MKNIVAALTFFTRLPLWRFEMFHLPSIYFKEVINYWAVVGWLTGGVMSAVFWASSFILPFSVSIIFALLSRLLLTGALHEDGLADFFDGFGGGGTRERVLEIMKDSHIGTYGVIALISFFSLFYMVLSSLPYEQILVLLFVVDPLCKFIAAQLTRFLPYARTVETSKAKTVYNKMSYSALFLSALFGLLPFFYFLEIDYWPVVLFPIFVFVLMVLLMKRKIQGYTGDCCGALFLMLELSFYIGVLIFNHCLV